VPLLYYRFFPGDFERKTYRLRGLDKALYMLLIKTLWESPCQRLPDNDFALAARLQLDPPEMQRMRGIISEFCTVKRGWIKNKRVVEEYEHGLNRRNKSIKAINTRWEKEKNTYGRNTNVVRSNNVRNTNQNQNQKESMETLFTTESSFQESPLASKKARSKKIERASDVPLPDWIPREQWNGYVEARNATRYPLKTAYAIRTAIRKLDYLRREGEDLAAVLDQSTLQGWRGLFPVAADDIQRKHDPVILLTAKDKPT
jgi:uncharacterized protein YdaU (DUF1376 family)